MIPVAEAIETYLYVVAALGVETIRLYRRSLYLFQEFCEAQQITLDQVTPKVFRAFTEHITARISPRSKQPIQPITVHLYLRAVKVFLAWTSDYDDYLGAIKPGSLKAMRVPKSEKKVMPVLTPEEFERMYEACKKNSQQYIVDRDRALLSVLLDTGLRASEICTLRVGNVHLQDMEIKVQGKGRKQRELKLGMKARLDVHKFLSRHRRGAGPEEYVFLSYKRHKLSQTALDQIIKRLKKLAGIEKEGGAHMFRRTFATLFIENGGDIYDLRDLMGHEHISTTEGYIRSINKRITRQRAKSVLDNL